MATSWFWSFSARVAPDGRVAALDFGADDFVSKAFDIDELLARLGVALRHYVYSASSFKIVRRGDLTIDLGNRIVGRVSEKLHLTVRA